MRKEFVIVLLLLAGIFSLSFFELPPVKQLMNWRAVLNTKAVNEVALTNYQVYDYSDRKDPEITVDFLKGKHFWNPQVVIWLEDSAGNYLETLLVTTSTARGLFYAGRSAENFKESDRPKAEENSPTRRVDALPYWSHKRGHQYPDGLYSPPPSDPLPDAITGATPSENFYFQSGSLPLSELKTFRVFVEVNVAFDENEYYSEYDFPDDSLYHSGTGLLGQPSIIYSATIHKTDANRYYVLSMIGHGHHSGSTGELFTDMSSLTTAQYVVERIVVGVNEAWYNR